MFPFGDKLFLMGYIVFIYFIYLFLLFIYLFYLFINLDIGRLTFRFKIFELSVYEKMNLFLSTNIYEIKMYLQ
jgi:hypothetical protein